MELRFDENGLIPAVVQDVATGKVLMVAYMNKEALEKTLTTGTTWFYSRSRKKLWNKGETSGHVQQVERIYVDCDSDCLLVLVRQKGVACHTGFFSCFHRELQNGTIGAPEAANPPYPLFAFLGELAAIVEERAKHPSPSSYTARLLSEGREKILRKVIEEATEVLLATFEDEHVRREHLRYEVADLLYHLLVLLQHEGVNFGDVMEELKNRHTQRSQR